MKIKKIKIKKLKKNHKKSIYSTINLEKSHMILGSLCLSHSLSIDQHHFAFNLFINGLRRSNNKFLKKKEMIITQLSNYVPITSYSYQLLSTFKKRKSYLYQ